MSFKSTKQNLGPSKSNRPLLPMKKQGNGILYEMFGELLSLYIPGRFFVIII